MPRRKIPVHWPRQREVGLRLGQVRDKLRYGRKDFAAALGLRRSQLVDIEVGRTALRYRTALRLRELFQVDLFWLAGVPPMLPGEAPSDAGQEPPLPPHTLLTEVPPLRLCHAPTGQPEDIWMAINKGNRYRTFIERDLQERLRRLLVGIPDGELSHFWRAVGDCADAEAAKFPALSATEARRNHWAMEAAQAQENAWRAEHPGADDFKLLEDAEAGPLSIPSQKVPGSPAFSARKELTSEPLRVTKLHVQPILPTLLERLRHATAARGRKTELAGWLGVPRQSVNGWLAGAKEPSGETTLRLLAWVTAEEAKPTKSPAGATTPAEPKTQVRKQYEQRPNSDPP